MKGYKAFGKGLICKGKQYAENTVFEEDKAEICRSGMHFCENPFDVLDYYPLVNDKGEFSEFAEVEALADVKTDDEKKYCTTKLQIGAKLSFAGFIDACINFLHEKTINNMPNSRVDSGDAAQIGSSGDAAQIGSSGDAAKIGSSGYAAKIGSSGDAAKIGSSGDAAQIGSSGYAAKIGSSGDYAKIGSSGDAAQIGSSGDYAQIVNTGEDCVICCAGRGSIVKTKVGTWVTLAEWDWNKEKGRYVPVCVKTEYVDGERIKADTPYKLENGEFVEVK